MTQYGMTIEQLHDTAPSIFTGSAYEKTSSKYRLINTASVLDSLMDEGFVPFSAKEARTRSPEKVPYVKHVVRLRHREDVGKQAVVGDTVNEILLANSYDGTKPYELKVGCFRFVCLNGMVVGDTEMNFRILHKGDPNLINEAVVNSAFAARGMFDKVNHSRARMMDVLLTHDQRLDFAEKALEIKFGERTPTLLPGQLLNERRSEDHGTSLWQTFQVIQENVVRGGLEPVAGRNSGRRSRLTRPITSINEDIRVNQELWNTAESYI